MRESKTLTGKQIITLNDGTDLGVVKEIYFDTNLNSIVAVGIGDLFKPQTSLISINNIMIFGQDALLVVDSNIMIDRQESLLREWIQRGQLRGRFVTTEEGQQVGFISEVLLDDQGGVSGFTLAHTHLCNPLITIFKRSAVLDVGGVRSPMMIGLHDVI